MSKTTNHCFVCNVLLKEGNSSDEHLLLNALGGHIHTKKLLCKNCNDKFGNSYDQELADELAFAASLLNIPRQRGDNQVIKTIDEFYDILPGGVPILKKPILNKEKLGNKSTVHVEARSEAEMKRILADLARKHPSLDPEEAFKTVKHKTEKIDRAIPVRVHIQASLIYPSIVRSVVEYYLLCGGQRKQIQHLIPVIEGRTGSDLYCKYFFPADDLFRVSPGEILHILYIKSINNFLFGFISYFGIVDCVVILNEKYTGPSIEQGYAYNIVTREERTIQANYDLSKRRVLECINTPFEELYNPLIDRVKRYFWKMDLIKVHYEIEPELSKLEEELIEQQQIGLISVEEFRIKFINGYTKLLEPWLIRHIAHGEDEEHEVLQAE